MLHFAISISLFWFGCSRGIDFFQNIYVRLIIPVLYTGTLSNLFLEQTSTEQMTLKFLAQGNNGLPLTGFESMQQAVLRFPVRRIYYLTMPSGYYYKTKFGSSTG